MRLKLSATVAILAGLILLAPLSADGKAWKGIVPLYSTRADVERLIGLPDLEDSGYDIDGQQIRISYSSQGCQPGLPGGWKVPPNTVLSISISASDETKLPEVVSGKNYEQIYAVNTRQVDYLDVQEGVRYSTLDGAVLKVTYLPTEDDDKKLRCGEYKYAAPVPASAKNRFEEVPYDSYGKIPFQDASARLDKFMVELESLNLEKPHYRGFIIVYAGRSSYAAEAVTIAECSRNYLVSVRKADSQTVIGADGGYRDEFTVELFIMPNDAYPPRLMPTVSPQKIEILPGAVIPCRK